MTNQKRIISTVLVICMALSLLAGCGGPAYVKGTLTDTSFESEYLDLRFTAPDGYVMSTPEEIDNMMNIGAEAVGLDGTTVDYAKLTTVYEMMVTSTDGFPNVVVMAEKLALSNMTPTQYLDSLKTQLTELTTLDYSINGEISTAEIAGQSYDKLSTSVSTNGVDLVQDYFVRKQNNRVVAFIVSYLPGTESDVDALMAAFTKF